MRLPFVYSFPPPFLVFGFKFAKPYRGVETFPLELIKGVY